MATEHTTARHTSGYRIWHDRIMSGRITHAQAVQFCHAIQGRADGYEIGGHRSNVTQDEAQELVAMIGLTTGLIVDDVAAKRGRKWLATNERRLHLPHLAWGDITMFLFVGAYDHGGYGYRGNYGPIYRAVWSDGATFEYAPTAWQIGGSDRHMWWQQGHSVPPPAAAAS